jgi:protein involved in polysaccharide export with SLBB domain
MALAGGGGHGAAMNSVHLVRTYDGGRKEDIHLEVKRILLGKAPDVELKDGDILYVPTSNVKLFTEQAINSAIGIGTSVAIYRTAY